MVFLTSHFNCSTFSWKGSRFTQWHLNVGILCPETTKRTKTFSFNHVSASRWLCWLKWNLSKYKFPLIFMIRRSVVLSSHSHHSHLLISFSCFLHFPTSSRLDSTGLLVKITWYCVLRLSKYWSSHLTSLSDKS